MTKGRRVQTWPGCREGQHGRLRFCGVGVLKFGHRSAHLQPSPEVTSGWGVMPEAEDRFTWNILRAPGDGAQAPGVPPLGSLWACPYGLGSDTDSAGPGPARDRAGRLLHHPTDRRVLARCLRLDDATRCLTAGATCREATLRRVESFGGQGGFAVRAGAEREGRQAESARGMRGRRSRYRGACESRSEQWGMWLPGRRSERCPVSRETRPLSLDSRSRLIAFILPWHRCDLRGQARSRTTRDAVPGLATNELP